jgi:hypothetical protein
MMTRPISLLIVALSWLPSAGFALHHWALVITKKREVNRLIAEKTK